MDSKLLATPVVPWAEADGVEAVDESQAVRGAAAGGARRLLPGSLSSLRAFEAVARRQSFTKAAFELNLTQTAVSHQVRKLETLLKVQLFIRDRDGVRLSDYGREYLPAVRSALTMLSSATQQILDRGDEETLSIVSLAAFGLKCILPRLPDFRRRHPGIRVRFESVVSFDAAACYNHDLSIRYGTGQWHGLSARRIAPENVFPVCSPRFFAEARLSCPSDLFGHTVISTSSVVFRDDWPEWLAHYGYSHDHFSDVIVCDTMLSAQQMAIDGMGVVMGRTPLVNEDLLAGRLMEPFQHRVASASGYYLTCAPDRAERAAVRLFTDWLLAQFQPTQA